MQQEQREREKERRPYGSSSSQTRRDTMCLCVRAADVGSAFAIAGSMLGDRAAQTEATERPSEEYNSPVHTLLLLRERIFPLLLLLVTSV